MLSRRRFLETSLAGAATARWAGVVGLGPSLVGAVEIESAPTSDSDPAAPRRLAVLTTEWRHGSHAWHMAERFLVGYPRQGRWHTPPFRVVSAYVDQTPDNDLSRARAREFGFTIYPTVAEALTVGGDQLAVDAVLLIGEHGDYPRNEFGQTLYPRYELFAQTMEVFRRSGRVAPVFNDKHLSWSWEHAQEMVAWARELGVPFLAGSSLPVTWRMPAVDLPWGAEVEEALCLAMGAVDSYDFHALEVIQSMVERRRGGETGVAAVEALRGEAVWRLLAAWNWDSGGCDPALWEACLARSQTLAQPESFSHRRPTPEQIRQFVADPVAYRIEYRDGLRATMLLLNGLVNDFTFAARLRGEPEPLSTLFYLPPNPNVAYSAALMAQVEETFSTGRPPYPVERTLLTTGLVEAGVQSLAAGRRRETPHLNVAYQAPRASTFWSS